MAAANNDIEFDAANHRKAKRKEKNKATGPGAGTPDSSYGADGLTERQRVFLECYVIAPSLNRACHLAEKRGVKISRSNPSVWMKGNPTFASAFKRAKKEAIRFLETEARRRAVEGVEKLKFHKGEPIINPETGQQYSEREYSDALLTLLLKSNFPEKYRERSDVNLTGSLDISRINEAELEERERRLGLIPQRFTLPTAEQAAN